MTASVGHPAWTDQIRLSSSTVPKVWTGRTGPWTPDSGLFLRRFAALQCRIVVGEDAPVERAAFQQLVVRADIDHFALAQYDHFVRPADLGEAVGDEDRGAAFQHAADGSLNLVLGLAVDRAGRVVDDQDCRIGDQRAGDSDALPLATGEGDAPLADDRFVAIG